MVFSSDGALLASGLEDGTVMLWDVASQTNSATLSRHPGGVTAVAFSPDGETLATGSRDNTVKLWDVFSGRRRRFPVRPYRGNNFGRVFPRRGDACFRISGHHHQAVGRLRAVSAPSSNAVENLGRQPGGNPGSDLADPHVVEVRDQYGNPLQDVQVTFSIASGSGKLGGLSTEEAAVTGSDGRAQSILTLGPGPGKNSVEAAVRGLEPVTFFSVGVGTPVTPAENDYPTWHLPDGAIARLGKGRLSQADRAIAFSPGGQRLAAVSAIGIWLYDMATFRPQALLPTGINQYGALAFSPDGTILASRPGR